MQSFDVRLTVTKINIIAERGLRLSQTSSSNVIKTYKEAALAPASFAFVRSVISYRPMFWERHCENM